jgi:hypothetical protein
LTSVPQIDATATFSNTSPGPGCGTGRRSTRISSASWSTTAVIISEIAIDRTSDFDLTTSATQAFSNLFKGSKAVKMEWHQIIRRYADSKNLPYPLFPKVSERGELRARSDESPFDK